MHPPLLEKSGSAAQRAAQEAHDVWTHRRCEASSRSVRGNDGLAIGIPFEQLEQAVNVAKDPQVSHLPALETKERRTQPLNGLARRLVAEEHALMDPGKSHARERLRILDNEIKDLAAIAGKGGVHTINVRPETGVADRGLTERPPEGEADGKRDWNLRLVVSAPDVGVEALDDSSNL
jgi:hypothetical protein